MKKRLISLVLALSLLLTLVPLAAQAAAQPAVRCDDLTAAPGDTLCIPLRAEGLESLAALELELYYDPAIVRFSHESQGWLLGGAVYHVSSAESGKISLSAVSSQGISGEGVLVYLYFTVAADCPEGEYPLTLAVGEAYNAALAPVTMSAHSGTLTVTRQTPVHGPFHLGMELSAESLSAGETLTVTLCNDWRLGFSGLDLQVSYDSTLFELVRAEVSGELAGNAIHSLNTSIQGLVRLTCATNRNLWCRDLLILELRAKDGATGNASISATAADVYDESLIPYQPGSAEAQVTILEPQPAIPGLRLSADPVVIEEESFATVTLDAGSGLAAADFRMEYDPALLECLGVESAAEGGYLVINPNFSGGSIRFSYVNESGALGETPLVKIRWRAKAGADRHYTIRTTLIDPVDKDHNRLQIDLPDHSGCIYREELADATCTQPGGAALVCVGCGHRIPLDPTPALGHAYGQPAFRWSDDHASCTASRVCARDASHVWRVSCAVTQGSTGADCTAPGSITYTASADFEGEIFTDEVTVALDALGHDYSWEVVTEPGCTTEGLRQGSCIRCGDAVQEVLAPLGHEWEGNACRRCGEIRENPFTDVPEGSFYYDPVIWAVAKGITNGTSATTFGPGDSCMRAHVVTFLWRAAGSPEPTSTNNPFVDVKETDFYYKAVLWAVENGITNGLDAAHFGPFAYCNRAQVVTFLHRALKSPKPTMTQNPFTDVPAGQWFTDPVLWAVENGITNGLSATAFGPTTVCNRAQIVTFLYRAFA